MLADHTPHQLAVDWYYSQILLVAVLAIMVVVGVIAGPNLSARSRLLLGAGIGLTVVLPTMTWGYCSDSRIPLGLLVLLLATPALVALSDRWIPRSFADGSFIVAAVAVLGLFLVGQSRGCWRDESYFSYNPTFYLVLVALPMVAGWLFAWGWSHPTRARAILKRLVPLPREPASTTTGPSQFNDETPARLVPSDAQAQRANVLAQMAIAPMVVGLILIPTVILALPGVLVLGTAWAVRRASRPVRAGQSQWPTRSTIVLAVAGLLTVSGALALLVWAIQEGFSFSSGWSYAGLLGALLWSTVFTALIIESLADWRRSGKRPESIAIGSSDADSVSRQ